MKYMRRDLIWVIMNSDFRVYYNEKNKPECNVVQSTQGCVDWTSARTRVL